MLSIILRDTVSGFEACVAHGTHAKIFQQKQMALTRKILNKNNSTPREKFSAKKIAPCAKHFEQKKSHPAQKIFSKKHFPQKHPIFLTSLKWSR
jgi:hypothetical protein